MRKKRSSCCYIRDRLPADDALTQAKKDGFSDKYLSQLLEIPEEDIRDAQNRLGVEEAWEGVHVSGTKDSAYYYSTYHMQRIKTRSAPTNRRS